MATRPKLRRATFIDGGRGPRARGDVTLLRWRQYLDDRHPNSCTTIPEYTRHWWLRSYDARALNEIASPSAGWGSDAVEKWSREGAVDLDEFGRQDPEPELCETTLIHLGISLVTPCMICLDPAWIPLASRLGINPVDVGPGYSKNPVVV